MAILSLVSHTDPSIYSILTLCTVRQPDRFMQEVVGTRSKHIEYSSFVSLLKKHQFRRITHRQQGALRSDRIHEYHHYTHFFFVRNQQILLSYIQRKDLPVLGYPVQASGVGGQSQPGLKSISDFSLEGPEKSLLLMEETTRILTERSKESRDEHLAIRNKLSTLQASEGCGQSQPGLKSKIDLSLEEVEKSLLLLEEVTRKLNETRNKLGDSLRQTLGSQLAESGIA
jgi:hypothetical protein